MGLRCRTLLDTGEYPIPVSRQRNILPRREGIAHSHQDVDLHLDRSLNLRSGPRLGHTTEDRVKRLWQISVPALDNIPHRASAQHGVGVLAESLQCKFWPAARVLFECVP